MKKSARVSEKLVSSGLPVLQVATPLISEPFDTPCRAYSPFLNLIRLYFLTLPQFLQFSFILSQEPVASSVSLCLYLYLYPVGTRTYIQTHNTAMHRPFHQHAHVLTRACPSSSTIVSCFLIYFPSALLSSSLIES